MRPKPLRCPHPGAPASMHCDPPAVPTGRASVLPERRAGAGPRSCPGLPEPRPTWDGADLTGASPPFLSRMPAVRVPAALGEDRSLLPTVPRRPATPPDVLRTSEEAHRTTGLLPVPSETASSAPLPGNRPYTACLDSLRPCASHLQGRGASRAREGSSPVCRRHTPRGESNRSRFYVPSACHHRLPALRLPEGNRPTRSAFVTRRARALPPHQLHQQAPKDPQTDFVPAVRRGHRASSGAFLLRRRGRLQPSTRLAFTRSRMLSHAPLGGGVVRLHAVPELFCCLRHTGKPMRVRSQTSRTLPCGPVASFAVGLPTSNQLPGLRSFPDVVPSEVPPSS